MLHVCINACLRCVAIVYWCVYVCVRVAFVYVELCALMGREVETEAEGEQIQAWSFRGGGDERQKKEKQQEEDEEDEGQKKEKQQEEEE